MTSLSTRFLGRPRLTKPTFKVKFLRKNEVSLSGYQVGGGIRAWRLFPSSRLRSALPRPCSPGSSQERPCRSPPPWSQNCSPAEKRKPHETPIEHWAHRRS